MPKELRKTKNEIIMRWREDKIYKYCPFCGNELTPAWEHICEDDSNPVRMCPKCGIAWIWR